MDDLIYSFLLQSDYPRASIVLDVDLLESKSRNSGLSPPTFIIVDPDSANTAEPLAVIEVVDAVDGDTLRAVAIETGAYASKLAGKQIQGFVVRVDVNGRMDAEQVQFYKIWPNSTLRQLTTKTFPDLDTLRVSRKLSQSSTINGLPHNGVTQAMNMSESVDGVDESLGLQQDSATESSGAGLYIPAVFLLLLFIADILFSEFLDEPLFTVAQSILVFGAAALLSLPSLVKLLRN